MTGQILKKIIITASLCVMFVCLSVAGVSAALQGDVNLDGKLNAADARLTLRIAARVESADNETYLRADADLNGRVTSADARLILRVSAGIDSFDMYEEPTVETTKNNCCSEDDVTDNDIAVTPTKPSMSDTSADKHILMDDILGSAVGKYEEKLGLIQCTDGQRNRYEGDNITVTVFGTSHTAYNVIESVTTTRKDISVSGITVGLTVGQTENCIYGMEHHIETIDGRYSRLSFNYKDYIIQVFFDNGISCMISGGKENPVNYSADELIDMSTDVAFGGYANNCNVTENEDGTVTYEYIGLRATACAKSEGMVVDRIILEGESDYNIGLVYTGMNVGSLYDIAEKSGFTVSDNGGGIYLLVHKRYTAEVVTNDGIIIRIELLSTDRPYVTGQSTDLSFIMGEDISGIDRITDKQPVISETDNNIWFYDGFYLTTQGCMSATPDSVCAVAVCARGYGFSGIDFGMPVDMLTEFLDGNGVNYLYDADSGILKITSGEYGDYTFLITLNNGFVDWIEVSAGTYDSLYALNFMLMTTVDTSAEPFSHLAMTEDENGQIRLTHDCAEFFLTEKDGVYILTRAVINRQCDFNVMGFTVGDDVIMIETELINNGFSELTVIEDGFTAKNTLYEIRVHEEEGSAVRIELVVI